MLNKYNEVEGVNELAEIRTDYMSLWGKSRRLELQPGDAEKMAAARKGGRRKERKQKT